MESENHRQTPALPAVTLDHVQGFVEQLCRAIRELRCDPEFSAKNLRTAYQQGHKDALEQAEDATREALELLMNGLAGGDSGTAQSG